MNYLFGEVQIASHRDQTSKAIFALAEISFLINDKRKLGKGCIIHV